MIIIFFILLSFATPQTITLIDFETRIPIENVNVFVGNNGITTDSYGSCSLGAFNNGDTVTFSMIGYKTITLPFIDIPEVVYLKNEAIPMDIINIVGKGKKSKRRYSRLERNDNANSRVKQIASARFGVTINYLKIGRAHV